MAESIVSTTDRDYPDGQFDRLMDLANAIGLEHSTWSLYGVVDKIDDIAIENVIGGVHMKYSSHWGEDKDLMLILPSTCTWRQLAHAADKLIEMSGDEHHIFIEDFVRNGNTLELETGS